MGISIKPGKGDLVGVRAKSTGKVADARAKQIITQSENGFKGQILNDHGLPAGPTDIIQDNKYSSEGGAKFRKEKYADGVKGIKLKPKIAIASDATSTKAPTNLKLVADVHATKISKMSDKDLMTDAVTNSIKGDKGRDAQDIDSLASRNIKRRGGYKDGTKSIRVKSK